MNPELRRKRIVQTSVIGIIGNLLLVGMKITIGLIVNAISIISDGINNLTDALSSLITLIGTKLSGKKPDKKHPYGHGRIEYITSFIIGILVLIAGGTAIFEAIMGLIQGAAVANYTNISLIIISAGIAIKIALGIIFKVSGKKYNSDALSASGTDAIGDVILSTSTLVVAIICFFVKDAAKIHLENYLSILIGLFIIKAGVGILKDSTDNIVGKRADQELINHIKTLVNCFPEVQGAYDLILNNYGPERMIGSVHIQVDDDLTAKQIHTLTRKIQEKIFGECGVILTVGIYANNDSEEASVIKKDILELTQHDENVNQIHGFYVDNEKHLVTFDIIIEYTCPDHEGLKNNLIKELKTRHPSYDFYIVEDMDISD